MCAFVRARACGVRACVCLCVCVRACVCACVCAWTSSVCQSVYVCAPSLSVSQCMCAVCVLRYDEFARAYACL